MEEYRYDALGRRVLRRFRRECRRGIAVTNWPCKYNGETVRYVYDGDEILYEIRAPGLDTASAAIIERDMFAVAEDDWGSYGQRYGVVLYTHGPQLDQPLAATPTDMGCCAWFGKTVFLHKGPDGRFQMGTDYQGKRDIGRIHWELKLYSHVLWQITPDHEDEESGAYWYGSLLEIQTDGSQNVYMRNRYYDPQSGRFTQEDPIGLAGGMNLYGYANGDPVNFSDPFGLSPVCDPPGSCIRNRMAQGAVLGFGAGVSTATVCVAATEGACALGPAEAVIIGSTLDGAAGGLLYGAGEELAPVLESVGHKIKTFLVGITGMVGGMLGPKHTFSNTVPVPIEVEVPVEKPTPGSSPPDKDDKKESAPL